MTRTDTIAAIATAPGRAGVAVVRISGGDAWKVGASVAGRALRPGVQFVRTPYDECLVLAFRNPKSYTGEDVVEFQCHGGDVTPRRILEAAFASGARLARRGEFTERAFLNGKLDALQAESVLDLINAKTARAAEAALEGLSGRKRTAYRELYDGALALSTQLEHALDVSEEELPESFFASVNSQLSTLNFQLSSLLARAGEGKLLRNGACVVLAGPPNAGKSSLLNALLGESRAIVSDVPGTTRDSIEEWMDLEGYPVRLVDTAGLRETEDAVEAEGVRRSEELIAKADVVVVFSLRGTLAASPEDYDGHSLRDRSVASPEDDDGHSLRGKSAASPEDDDGHSLRDRSVASPKDDDGHSLRGKSAASPEDDDGHSLRGKSAASPESAAYKEREIRIHAKCDLSRGDGLNVSAKTGEGLDELKRRIVGVLRANPLREDGSDTPSERAVSVLLDVRERLAGIDAAAFDLVLAANALRSASEALGTLVGATYSSDLMESLFSRFCVGK